MPCGSIRPGYNGAMNLGDLSDALVSYENGNKEPFARYRGMVSAPGLVRESRTAFPDTIK
jgi:hypothetical protein